MLPFWMELDVQDLIQGTMVLAMAAMFFVARFLAPAGRV
jgi:hypothetical protein